MISFFSVKLPFLLLAGLLTTFSLTAKDRTGWYALFGKNLAEADYVPGGWMQKGNIIHAGPEEFIWSIEEYDNFELDLEFNNSPLATSSIILTCPDRDLWDTESIRILLAAPPMEEEEELLLPICGTIYGQDIPVRNGIVKNPGEWNHLRIRLAGGRLSIILNGRKITEWNVQTAMPLPPAKGFIGLEGGREEYPITFRNIRIRELPESESGIVSSGIPRRERERTFPTY